MDRAHTTPAVAPPAALPMSSLWRTIRGYILWSYERGTIQYDVMVSLILIFLFASPYFIEFKDKPVDHNPHRTGVVVTPGEGLGALIFQIEGRAVQAKDDAAIRAELLSVIEPISGEVTISKYEPVRDKAGKVQFYKVWVQR